MSQPRQPARHCGEKCSSRSSISETEEIDRLDAECTHVLATSGDTPVGAAKIQRVCVSKEFRGKGVGAEIIDFIVGHARRHRLAPFARLGSQTHALYFHRKLGFEAYGDDYLDAGIPHHDMQLKL